MSGFKPLDFFKRLHVFYLAKNWRKLEDAIGGDPFPSFAYNNLNSPP